MKNRLIKVLSILCTLAMLTAPLSTAFSEDGADPAQDMPAVSEAPVSEEPAAEEPEAAQELPAAIPAEEDQTVPEAAEEEPSVPAGAEEETSALAMEEAEPAPAVTEEEEPVAVPADGEAFVPTAGDELPAPAAEEEDPAPAAEEEQPATETAEEETAIPAAEEVEQPESAEAEEQTASVSEENPSISIAAEEATIPATDGENITASAPDDEELSAGETEDTETEETAEEVTVEETAEEEAAGEEADEDPDRIMLDSGFVKVMVIRENGTNLYSDTSTDAKAAGTLNHGDVIWVRAVEGIWGEIHQDEESAPLYLNLNNVALLKGEVGYDIPIRKVRLTSTLDGLTEIEEGTEITITAEFSGFVEDEIAGITWQYRTEDDEEGSFRDIEEAHDFVYTYCVSAENIHNEWRIVLTLKS